ncbi:hypothetical protein HQ545_05550 [Candidatus Woesearchaeota archaeon]|nr:hypothetical protein [Candidatus Woesearchaeota archaeon]
MSSESESKNTLSEKERIAKGQVLTKIIIEVLGAPKEHVEEAIKIVVDKVNAVGKIEVVSESTYEAEPKGKLFSTFSEIEIWFDDIDALSMFLFEFTPSSVEVVQPVELNLKSTFMSGFMNDFLLKMHDMGLKMKDGYATTKLLKKNTDALIRNFMKSVLLEPKSGEEVAKITGIPKENVDAILADFSKAGIVKEEDGVYSFIKKE